MEMLNLRHHHHRLLPPLIFSLILSVFPHQLHGEVSTATQAKGGLEEWGYVEVRPKAHMFWWLYRSPNKVDDPSKPWPTILWLQGGPGGSGVGIGNFEEIGPLDSNLKPRNSTWLQVADLLFVDNPVGTGYSFVEDMSLLVKTDEEAATDLTTLLEKVFNGNKSPLHIVAESYGGKFAVTLALSVLKAIEAGKLKLNLGGVALGDSWISPEDFVFSWGPLLKDLSRLDTNGVTTVNRIAEKIKQQTGAGNYASATSSWSELEDAISLRSGNVDFYNFLLDSGSNSKSLLTVSTSKRTIVINKGTELQKYSTYLNSMSDEEKDSLMDGVIRKKLKIIPPNILWGGQADKVFEAMSGDFMKPRIKEVDELLAKGVNVTIYNGQLDLICSTKGAEAWVEKLRWHGLSNFLIKDRTALRDEDKRVKAFAKSFHNLHFFWILGAGHFVPVDEPSVSLKMAAAITHSPAKV